MRVLNLFTGISAPSVAWQALGWETAAFAEINPAACSVLAHHYPGVPNLGSVTDIHLDRSVGSVGSAGLYSLVVGGPPCQSYSIAGLRGGLDDPRGNMAIEYFRVVRESGARWMVFENVPGLLSSGKGRDFGRLLGLGSGWGDIDPPDRRARVTWGNAGIVPPAGPGDYGLAWRILDARYFGVAQRRRRVFIVGYLGDWRPAAAVLFERSSLSGDIAAVRAEGARVAPSVTPGARRASGNRGGEQLTVGSAAYGSSQSGERDTAACLTRHGMRLDFDTETFVADTLKGHHPRGREDDTYITGPTHTLRADGFDASEDGTGRGTPLVPVAIPAHGDTRHSACPRHLAARATATGKAGTLITLSIRQPTSATARTSARWARSVKGTETRRAACHS